MAKLAHCEENLGHSSACNEQSHRRLFEMLPRSQRGSTASPVRVHIARGGEGFPVKKEEKGEQMFMGTAVPLSGLLTMHTYFLLGSLYGGSPDPQDASTKRRSWTDPLRK